ncbi:MAG TPA: thiamine pyrophosphate-binding protein [Acetobacteraceae bacterium]|jgi:acetolactate synthase-1/2/3 large subunit|nr:thiamine pyrophosphate-binding protein [Acetobacteraceae bacterium]
MTATLRGADIVVRTLDRAGHTTIFTLSGNHIMSLFDAAIGSRLDLIHTRHEAAAVHAADAFGRLTGRPGLAMVTGGPGHANATAALMTALGQEAPLVLLSGHTETTQLGRGGFQELRQAEMAAPVAKASWVATDTARLGVEVAKAIRIATAGRPGPVHLSLPSDLLDAEVPATAIAWPGAADFIAEPVTLSDPAADTVLALIAGATRPLLIAGPQLANRSGRALLARIENATNVPACIMESPRGFADATLGAFADLVARCDLIVLLGKALDFTLKFGAAPAVDPACRFVMIDPDATILQRAIREKGPLLTFGCVADTHQAGNGLIRRASGHAPSTTVWLREARSHLTDRPAFWETLASQTADKLHAIEVFRALKPYVERNPDTVLVCDGGEFAQWGQSLLSCERRMINGVTGSIGSSLPMALGARVVEGAAPVFAVLGDGTFGFHMAEFETAVRRNLPFVAVVGTDARWNAEYNLQVRDYGANRAVGCELMATRYDLVVTALGGHGELVRRPQEMQGAIERALASGKPACINVMIEAIPAPTVRRTAQTG